MGEAKKTISLIEKDFFDLFQQEVDQYGGVGNIIDEIGKQFDENKRLQKINEDSGDKKFLQNLKGAEGRLRNFLDLLEKFVEQYNQKEVA